MATSITMETSYSGKQSTRSITNVNPNATAEEISTFAKGLNDLTNNTLKTVNRIDKQEIDTDVVYSPVEAYNNGDPLPSTVTIDGLTVNIDNKSIAEEVDFQIAFRIKDVENSEFTFDTMTVKNTVGAGIYAGYSFTYQSGTRPRTQIEFYYFANQTGAAATTTFTIPGGSTTVGGTTYYYAPFTLTVNQLGQ